MIIQIFGKKSCNTTKKAERFFKERNIKVQFINILEKIPSNKELQVITSTYPIEDLLDVDGAEYKKRNLKYMVYNTEELLLENPILFKTPIIRKGIKVVLGEDMEAWKELIK